MWFVILCFLFPVVLFTEFFVRVRYKTVRKAIDMVNATNLPEWKAWRLSAFEPFITTPLTLIMGFGYVMGLPYPLSKILITPNPVSMMFIVPMLNMLLFALLIQIRGKGCRRGRLANTVIFTRLLLLLIPLFMVGKVTLTTLALLAIPSLLLRIAFSIYRDKVIDNLGYVRSQDELTEMERMTQNVHFPVIEDGLGEFDLWDEQVALIERLKDEEEVATYRPDA